MGHRSDRRPGGLPQGLRRPRRCRGCRRTGISPHVDLASPVRGATFVPGSISYTDDHGHGTHVAGTIAAGRNRCQLPGHPSGV
ncbi:S8 family serine peptidase [Mesorhizobium sp. M0757]|uniref:S8 family serine peptidase n=1 Tax=Mesorhizobium sp. M0757 TaxID=2956993 RepID=UPI003338D92A